MSSSIANVKSSRNAWNLRVSAEWILILRYEIGAKTAKNYLQGSSWTRVGYERLAFLKRQNEINNKEVKWMYLPCSVHEKAEQRTGCRCGEDNFDRHGEEGP